MKQLEIHYQYRDGANWKQSTSRVFVNPMGLSADEAEKLLMECLFDDENFIAESVELPTCYFDDNTASDAHGLHEFLSVRETDSEPNDKLNRSINGLIRQFVAGKEVGWEPVRKIIIDDDLANEGVNFTDYVLSCSLSLK